MIRSMTGYSSVRAEEAGFSLVVSLKSINHRFLDLQVRLPYGLDAVDALVRRQVKDRVSRGHVEITVSLDRAGAPGIELNRKLLDAYVGACDSLRSEFGFSSEPDLVALLRIPGMVSADGAVPAEELDRIRQALERTLAETLEQLNAMRAQEGEALERDLRARFETLDRLAEGVAALARRAPELYRDRLQSRLRELLQPSPGSAEPEPGRLAQEVAYLASRADIAEELTRFRSHLDQVKELLDGGAAEVGKKLDFLLQEMNREANTLLSKTTDVPEVGPEISRQAIEMKTEIEKLREQAQNIE
ncbi:MAG TPA: YicC/YloC family endoribonuclease [Terriglobia bacterium]|nr:YicC/YloC family endoribonuclease [Terriglobia bacterium]